MNILVTGGTGFIGQSVIQTLEKAGHTVTPFDRTIGHDVRDQKSCNVAVKNKDAVIHLAGILGTHELFDFVQEAIDINIGGAVNIMQACLNNDAKYLGITMLPVFPSIYTATKVSSQRFASAFHHTYGLPVTHVRAFNAYGPKQAHGHGHPRKIIPAFSVEGWSNVPLKIWGDGTQAVDLIDVDDVAQVFLEALDVPGKDETIDAGTGVGLTVNEVAEFVLEVTGSTAGIEYLPMRRGEIPTQVVAAGEGWEHLTHRPQFDKLKLMKTILAYKDLV